ncbi:MAG: six-cysteine peptide SCIFF [Ruminococcaceae bacterium]|nr:six-cysteine peptide SCIFF [Oscillospiraceae bacterium]
MKNIRTINSKKTNSEIRSSGCGECQASCQSACKTSCTVANQKCEKPNKTK